MSSASPIRHDRAFYAFSRMQFLLIASCLLFGVATKKAVSQSQAGPPTGKTVQLSISLVLPDHKSGSAPRETTVQLQPLDWKSEPATGQVSEDATTLVRLPPGRYELTTTKPVSVNGHTVGWKLEVPVTEPTNQLKLSQENAVRVSGLSGADNDQDTSGESSESSPAHNAPDSNTRSQIDEFLKRWTSSLESRDLDTQMSCYAPRLQTYLNRHNVSRDVVRQDKQKFLDRYPGVGQLSLSNVRITTGDGIAEVTALKSWTFGGRRDWEGQVTTHLTLQHEDGQWVIVSEQERLVKESVPFGNSSATSGSEPE